jgi:fused signal recognition particle receptor
VLEVMLIIGVNGAGKTTSIAKLSRLYTEKGRKVLLAAGDNQKQGEEQAEEPQDHGETTGSGVLECFPVLHGDPFWVSR